MKLSEILEKSGLPDLTFADCVVTGITQVVEKVKEGYIYVAVCGKNVDGNMYIREALEKGAAAVISDRSEKRSFVVNVEDAREALGVLLSVFYLHPEKKMKIIGVTGTNGKTTVSHYIKHLLEAHGEKCGIIGTLGCFYGDVFVGTEYTTPICEDFFYELHKISETGIKYCVVEVSSQALSQKRTFPVKFFLGILTNIGRDHLDYHGNIENYINAKKTLFSMCDKALINIDDLYSYKFCSICNETYTFSLKNPSADYFARNINMCGDGIEYLFSCQCRELSFCLQGMGEMTVYNSLIGAAALDICGFSGEATKGAITNLPVIKGRMEKITDGKITAYVDFAHTPEALENVLSALLKIKKGRLICVFGCGGNRDRGKRGRMGEISSRLADIVIITTDNPRSENPQQITDDIYKGIKNNKNIFRIEDREEAIKFAVNKALSGDIILVAGKGHEEYQLKGNKKIYFSDKEILEKYMF